MRVLSRSHRALLTLVLVVFLGGIAALVVAQPQALATLWPTTRPSTECGGYTCHTPRPSRTPAPTTPAPTPTPTPPSPSGTAIPQLPQTGSKINVVTVTGIACVLGGLLLYAYARRRPRSRHRRA